MITMILARGETKLQKRLRFDMQSLIRKVIPEFGTNHREGIWVIKPFEKNDNKRKNDKDDVNIYPKYSQTRTRNFYPMAIQRS